MICPIDDEDMDMMVITKRLLPKPPPPPLPIFFIEKVDDDKDIEQTPFQPTEFEPNDPITSLNQVVEAPIDDLIVENVPFVLVQEAPIFPGCKGEDKAVLRDCFVKKIQKHVNRKFDVGLAEELGLSPGRKRISVVFKIDERGMITDVMARAPHPRLEKEAERTIRSLPKMIPGKQHNKPVGVRYSMPITFSVE